MIKNILKIREESNTYLTHVRRHPWSKMSSKIDEIGAFTTDESHSVAESFYFIYFHRALLAPVMSTDVSQEGVALFPF